MSVEYEMNADLATCTIIAYMSTVVVNAKAWLSHLKQKTFT